MSNLLSDIDMLIRLVEQEFVGDVCLDEPDDEPVSQSEARGPSGITFGHIRRARRALDALTASTVVVPKEPTKKMHDAARDWSSAKYGKPIGVDASLGCYRAMIGAA